MQVLKLNQYILALIPFMLQEDGLFVNPVVAPAVEEYLGIADTPGNLEAASPEAAVVARVVEAQRRLAVSTRARRGGLGALSMVIRAKDRGSRSTAEAIA